MNKLYFISLCFLSACSSPSAHQDTSGSRYSKANYGRQNAPGIYTVRTGDTLFSIAWRFGLDADSIARRNHLSDPDNIFVGQQLKLKTLPLNKSNAKKSIASTTPLRDKKSAKSRVANSQSTQTTITGKGWVWPIKGKVVRQFNPTAIAGNGVRIAGRLGQTVNAANSGVVVYQGNGLKGYGNVVVIKAASGLLVAYGYLNKIYVKKGQHIMQKQKIGTVGYSTTGSPVLHFEIHRAGKPVNPLSYIGSRYHF